MTDYEEEQEMELEALEAIFDAEFQVKQSTKAQI